MNPGTITASGHTNANGVLHLSLNVGVADADVAIAVQVKPRPAANETDPNGWPLGFFDRVAGSMPDLVRAPQGTFEDRAALD